MALPLRRPHKYHAVATEVEGIRFHSKREAQRYAELRLLEKAGEVRELELQPKFPLYATTRSGGTERLGVYIADFRFREGSQGILVVEDVKSPPTRTALYRWKKRHCEAQYGIKVREV